MSFFYKLKTLLIDLNFTAQFNFFNFQFNFTSRIVF